MSAVFQLGDHLPAAAAYNGERLLIFDAESLLLDPTQGIQHSLLAALRQLGQRLTRHAFRHWSLRTPLRESLAILLNSRDPQQLDQACDLFFQHFEQDGRFRCSLRPGALALLEDLARDPRFELHYLTHIGAQAAARLLDVYGIGQLVRSIFSSEAATCPGVRPQLMQQLVLNSRQPPSRWVLLSDHPYELMAAQELHLRSIALGYGRAPLPTLLQLDPDAIAADLPDVGAQLDELLHPSRRLQQPVHSYSIN